MGKGYAAEIVVRERDGEYRAGFASDIPQHEGWSTVRSFGKWFGCQMSYKPFDRAFKAAQVLAEKLGKGHEMKKVAVTIEDVLLLSVEEFRLLPDETVLGLSYAIRYFSPDFSGPDVVSAYWKRISVLRSRLDNLQKLERVATVQKSFIEERCDRCRATTSDGANFTTFPGRSLCDDCA